MSFTRSLKARATKREVEKLACNDVHVSGRGGGTPGGGTGSTLWDLAMIVAVTGLLLALHATRVYGPVVRFQVPLGMAVVFAAPGYGLSVALFARKAQLSWLERLTLSIVLSIVQDVFVGMVLYFAHLPITPDTFLVLLSAITLTWVPIAAWRRVSLPPRMRFVACRPAINKPSGPTFTLTAAALLVLVIIGTGAVIYAAVFRSPGEHYTALSILNARTGRVDPPLSAPASGSYAIQVAVTNEEHHVESYRLKIALGRQVIQALSIRRLPDRATWRSMVRLRMPAKVTRELVRLRLYLQKSSSPYREVHLWLFNVRPRRRGTPVDCLHQPELEPMIDLGLNVRLHVYKPGSCQTGVAW